MRRSFALTGLLALAAGFNACNYVDDPTPPTIDGGGGVQPVVQRKVLLEDLTGHRCNNCPRAARIAQSLKDDLFNENLILVGVHAGGFAAPYAPIGDGFYDTDHRIPAGNTYVQTFPVAFYPAGLVSRKPFDNSIVVSEGSWGSAVAAIAGEPSAFDLNIESISITGGALSTQVNLDLVEDVQGDHNLVIYLVEDHVVDWQLDSEATPPDVENYDHRHMLRAVLNDTWGQPVITGSLGAGERVQVNVNNYTLNPTWNTSNLYVVAYVYNTTTDEVMQAEERKYQP